MPTANGRRQNSSLKRKFSASKKNSHEEQKMADVDQSAGKLITFTIDANTARIVKLESLDATGARHELSDEEKASFVRQGAAKLEDALEQAFEAGIDCVLGEGAQDDGQESQEDAKLRHLLLTPLIEHSAAGRLLQAEVLHRAILETLVQHSMKPIPEAPQGPPPGTAS